MRNLPENLNLYRRVLVEEFLREWQFLLDVIAGRTQARADFTDKMLGLLKSASSAGLGQFEFPMVSALSGAIETAIDWGNDKRKGRHDDALTLQGLQYELEQLRLLLEAVSLEACRRYQFIIEAMLSEEPLDSVIPLAKAGVERMLEYIIRTQPKAITFKCLVDGLIAGRSGAYVRRYTNTPLQPKERMLEQTKYTAEGVYGRSALRTGDGNLFALTHKEFARHKMAYAEKDETVSAQSASFNYGYTKTLENSKDPKYGYMLVHQRVVEQLYGHLKNVRSVTTTQRLQDLTPNMAAKITQYQPSIVTINHQQLQGYARNLVFTPGLSLRDFIQRQQPNATRVTRIAIVLYDPDFAKERDLTKLKLTGGDLSHCVFQACQFGQSVANTKFIDSDVSYSDFTKVTTAEGSDFSQAQLSHSQFQHVNLKKAHLSQANASYAHFEEANCEGATLLGVNWHGANLTGMKTNFDLNEIKQHQDEFEKNQKDKQADIEQRIEAQQNQISQLQQQLSQLQIEAVKQPNKSDNNNNSTNTEPENPLTALITRLQTQINEMQIQQSYDRSLQLQKAEAEQQQRQTEIKQLEQRLTALESVKSMTHSLTQELSQLTTQVLTHQLKLNELENKLKEFDGHYQQKHQALEDKINQHGNRLDDLEVRYRHSQVTPEHIQALTEQTKSALTTRYRNFTEIQGLFGKPFNLEGQYINLQMLYHVDLSKIEKDEDKKKLEAEKEKSERQSQGRISSYKDLFGDKRTIKPEDLFKPNKDLFSKEQLKAVKDDKESIPNLLLIQGRAGIGKTVFMRYIAREWAKGNLFKEKTWVFTLILRELRSPELAKLAENSQQIPLWEWVYHSQFSQGALKKEDFGLLWLKSIEPAIKENKVLLLLDGMDEVPTQHPCQQALEALLQGQYAHVTKIITSRPYNIGQIPQQRRNCEIIGFTNKNIEQYIKTYFGENTSVAQSLLTHLKAQTLLRSTAHIPVNINMLCGIAEQSAKISQGDLQYDLSQLETLTGTYQAMEIKLFERCFRERTIAAEQKLPESRNRRIKFLLTEQFGQERQFLSVLALEAFKNQQSIVSRELIDICLDKFKIIEDRVFMPRVRDLGLIRPVIDSHISESEQSYEFLHLTFQEYYAAIYIAQTLVVNASSKHSANDSEEIIKLIIQQKLNPKWQIVWWFVAGLLQHNQGAYEQYMALLQGKINSNNANAVETNNNNSSKELMALNHDLIGQYELELLAKCADEARRETKVRSQIEERLQITIAQWFELAKRGLLLKESNSPLLTLLRLSPSWLRQQEEHDLFKRANLQVSDAEAKKEMLTGIAFLRLASPLVLKTFVELLSDKEWRVRGSAAEAVGELGAAAATPAFLSCLADLLQNNDMWVRSYAEIAVGGLGAAAATPAFLSRLVKLLRNVNTNVRRSAAYAVRYIGAAAVTPEILSLLVELFCDEESNARRSAAKALEECGIAVATPASLSRLADLLCAKYPPSHGYAHVYAKAADKFVAAATTPPEFLSRVAELLHDKEEYVRYYASGAVKRLDAAAAMSAFLSRLAELLRDKDDNVRKNAAEAVERVERLTGAETPVLLSRLAELLRDKEEYVRYYASGAVKRLDAAAATPAFLFRLPELLQDKEWGVRYYAAEALGGIDALATTPAFLSRLAELLQNKNSDIRISELDTVCKLGAAAATPAILSRLAYLLRDEDKSVRSAAANTFSTLAHTIPIKGWLERGLREIKQFVTQAQPLIPLIILLFYAHARVQIQWDSTNKNYCLIAFDDESEFQTNITLIETRVLRRLMPRVIHLFLEDTLFKTDLDAEIKSWPNLEEDPYLSDSRVAMITEVHSSAQTTSTSTTLASNASSIFANSTTRDKARDFYAQGKAEFKVGNVKTAITFFQQAKDNYKDLQENNALAPQDKRRLNKLTGKGKYSSQKLEK